MIDIVYFASIREQLGRQAESIRLEPNIVLLSFLQNLVSQKGDDYQVLLDESTCYAVNQCLVSTDHVLQDGDELAIFPPVTGG